MQDKLERIAPGVDLIYPAGTLAHPRDHVTLSRMSPPRRKLAELKDRLHRFD